MKRNLAKGALPTRYGLSFIFGGVLMLAAAYGTLGFDFSQSALWQQIEARILLLNENSPR